MTDAIVVGSGPNGLSAAVALAREGVRVRVIEAAEEIGGGTRSGELTVPGLIHDHCSAVHTMGIGSPFYADLDLERHGLEWRWPEIDLAHPLDGGEVGALVRSVERTAESLGEDGSAWRRLFGSSSAHMDELADDIFRPFLHLPSHPIRLVRFGLPAATPATMLARRFKTERARALFGGCAAHLFAPLSRPMSSSVAVAMIAAGHRNGWPVAKGGSRAIASALAAELREHGGEIETGRTVTSLDELPEADLCMLDLSPSGVAEVAGGRLPARVARAYSRYRHGSAAFKLDLAVEGGIPWANEECRRAGTIQLGGDFSEIVAGERELGRGRLPERPFVLLAQQYLADPERSEGDVHPIWAYAHVPSGWTGDVSEAIIDQIERFAPGVRKRIVATYSKSPAELEAFNANYVGGDIITGANTPWRILFRPRLALDPYSTGAPGVFICSAATPPGAGAHGMCGYNAAQSALRHLRASA